MRQIVLLGIMIVSSITFTSCEKETIKDLDTNNSNTLITTSREAGGSSGVSTHWGLHRHYFDNHKVPGVEGIDYGCMPPAYDCFDDIIVTLKFDQKILSEIIHNHNNGVNTIENDIDIFSTNKESLRKNFFSEDDIDNLINGVFTLEIKGDKVLSVNKKNYFIFKERTKIKKVYPIQIKK